MPMIEVTLVKGNSEEKIEELIGGVTDTVAKVIGVPKDKTWVFIHEIKASHAGVNGMSAKEITQQN